MAADHPNTAVNGSYGAHSSYNQPEPYQPSQAPEVSSGNGVASSMGQDASATLATTNTATADVDNKPAQKEHIGWYFVEQYYKTMSKEPGRLYLFYSKRSQFVSGDEAEKVPVAVGQRAINERIKELDIQDCKVRVTNVDTQESQKNILVQVIGEISNKAAPHRKFTQTFVLAEQPTGYYVLNDIFRYLEEEDDVEGEEPMENGQRPMEEAVPTTVPEPAPTTLTSSTDPVQQQRDAAQVDKKLEEDLLQKASGSDEALTEATPSNGVSAPEAVEVTHVGDTPAAAITEYNGAAETSQQAAESIITEEEAQPEKPRDPDPTPVASPPKATQAAPAQAAQTSATPKSTAPKTWASMVASNKTAMPVPNPESSTSSATAAPARAKPASSSIKESVNPQGSAGDEGVLKQQPNGQNGSAGWQMAGTDNNKRQGRPHSQSVSGNQDNVLGYVKNVTDKVDASILKETLNQFGKLVYFDVSRQKNCAFVEFADPAAYSAAVAANPHTIGGEQIFVEERRPRSSAYGGDFRGRGGMRGVRGGSSENRPPNQGRGGYSKDGGRGSYTNRGARGSGNPGLRRGQPQTA